MAGQTPPAAAFPLVTHTTTDTLGRTITYHLSQPSHPAPLLLLMQGSGCNPVLQRTGAATYSTVYDLVPFATEERFAVLAVEKPGTAANAGGSTPKRPGRSPPVCHPGGGRGPSRPRLWRQ